MLPIPTERSPFVVFKSLATALCTEASMPSPDLVAIKKLITKLETDLKLLKEAVNEYETANRKNSRKSRRSSSSSSSTAYRNAQRWYYEYVAKK